MRQGQPQNRQRSRGRGNNNNRNNNNNNRNQLNRSMESNGPDVRIRGTAAHIAEKYTQLANDAQTAGDTVGAQSYFQFAEHYNRLVAVAQAAIQQAREEQEARREARGENRDTNNEGGDDEERENRGRNRGRSHHRSRDENNEANAEGDQEERGGRRRRNSEDREPSVADGPQPVIDAVPAEVALNAKPAEAKPVEGEADAPEAPVKKTRRPRKPKVEPATAAEDTGGLPAFVTGAE